jgi:hypothetical protein
LWRISEWQLDGNADLFEIQKEFIRKMDAKLSEMTIKPFCIEKVHSANGKIFKEKNMIFPYPNGQLSKFCLFPYDYVSFAIICALL